MTQYAACSMMSDIRQRGLAPPVRIQAPARDYGMGQADIVSRSACHIRFAVPIRQKAAAVYQCVSITSGR